MSHFQIPASISEFQTPADWNVTSTSSVFRFSSDDSSAVVTTHDITEVRNIVTATFVVLNFLLAVAAGEYVKTKARRRFATGHAVPVRDLTSWLGLSDIAKYTWSLHSVPGGWLGLLMAFSSALGVMHQFLTNTLIIPALVPTRCVLDYGMLPPSDNAFSVSPWSITEAANRVYQSQLATLKNGGTRGIYSKLFADNEVPMFRPQPKDSHGAWQCANIKNDTVPWTSHHTNTSFGAGISPTSWRLYLNTSAYMFRPGPWAFSGSEVGTFTNGFIIWSAASLTRFESVRASIINGASITTGPPQAMDFDCILTLDQPIPLLMVRDVLTDWVDKAYSYQKSLSTVKDTGLWLEIVLDGITMLSLYNDNLVARDIVPAKDIGCVVDGTRISIGILAVLAVVGALVLLIFVARCCILLASVGASQKHRTDLLPFDLAHWQSATYRQSKGGPVLTLRELQNVAVRYDPFGDVLCMETHYMGPTERLFRQDPRSSAERATHSPDFELHDHGIVESSVYAPFSSPGYTFQTQRKPVLKSSYVSLASTTEYQCGGGCL